MKAIFTTVILLSLSFSIFSQSNAEETQSKSFEVGINATSFVKNFTGFGSENDVPIEPYILHFKFIKNSRGLRVHAGFNSAFDQTNINDFTQSNTILGNLKVGYELRTIAGKRWTILYGIDAISNIAIFNTTSITFEEVEIKRQTFEFGLSPFFGFAFFVNPKIYLSTEASLEAVYTTTKNTTIFSDPLVPNQTGVREAFRVNTKLPINLNFTVKF